MSKLRKRVLIILGIIASVIIAFFVFIVLMLYIVFSQEAEYWEKNGTQINTGWTANI